MGFCEICCLHAFAQSFALRLRPPNCPARVSVCRVGGLISVAKIKCVSCPNTFIGRAGSRYCSAACKQRAHRGSRNAIRNASTESVTDVAVATRAPRRRRARSGQTENTAGGHCTEAVALLAALNAEAAENAEARGEPPLAVGEDDWSAAERVVLEMIACAVDRKADLSARYSATQDEKLRIKLSGELRLLQAHIAQLLKQVKTDLPDPPTRTSRKASDAAKVRWRNGSR